MSIRKLAWHLGEVSWLRDFITPLARAYLRHCPVHVGKRWFWNEVVRPGLAWHGRSFESRTRFGSRVSGNTRDIVQQCLYYFGIWEPAVTRWIVTRLQPGDVFVDVGANIGYFSLLASKCVGRTGGVLAIEASPKIFQGLRQNLALNSSQNVRAVNVAAAATAGRVALFHGSEYNSGATSTLSHEDLEEGGEADALPLSQIITQDEAARTRLIKIDIEGGEWAALKGASELFRLLPPSAEWMVELHPAQLRHAGVMTGEVLKLFASAGYHAFHLHGYTLPEDCIPPFPPLQLSRLKGEVDQEMAVVFSRKDLAAH